MITLPKQKIFDVLQQENFVATFTGRSRKRREEYSAVSKMVLKTIVLNEKPHYQLNTFTETQHFTKNVESTKQSLDVLLDNVISEQLMQVHIQTPESDHYFRVTRDGVSASRTSPSKSDWASVAAHDHKKQRPVTVSNSLALLRALGICNESGQINASMQGKYKQINHFLSIALKLDVLDQDRLNIVDCGCGKAYLTMALYHYLVNIAKKRVVLIGIDSNPHIIDECNAIKKKLGFESVYFVCDEIANITHLRLSLLIADAQLGTEYGYDTVAEEPFLMPEESEIIDRMDLLVALHACDTATDDALALALRTNAGAILAAPCCHHYVNEKLRSSNAPELIAPLLRDGIVRERFADLLTDTMRRDILRVYGYSSELIEFVAQEHTMKNIMIRAERVPNNKSLSEELLNQLRAEREQWKVAPKLAEQMGI